jgi:hypothetical protein
MPAIKGFPFGLWEGKTEFESNEGWTGLCRGKCMAKKEKDGPNSTILGAAGEHYVMCQLLRRNMIAALAPAGVPNSDIVVTDKLGDRLCAVQVKVRRDLGSDGGWHMGQKHETLISPNLFYCFVQ